jgi:hypothetical protein
MGPVPPGVQSTLAYSCPEKLHRAEIEMLPAPAVQVVL